MRLAAFLVAATGLAAVLVARRRARRGDAHLRARLAREALRRRPEGRQRRLRRRGARGLDARATSRCPRARGRRRRAPSRCPTAASSSAPGLPPAARSCASPATSATVFADTHESAVNALAVDKAGAVYAATTSNKIYKVTQGKADVFATLADVDSGLRARRPTHAPARSTRAPGSDGKVMRVGRRAAARASTSRRTSPFVVAARRRATTAPSTPGRAARASSTASPRPGAPRCSTTSTARTCTRSPSARTTSVWAIANEGGASGASETTESSSRRNAGGRNPPGPSGPSRTKPGKGSLWRFDAQGRPERMMHHDDFHYVSLALDDGGAPYVGTGAEGRVYTVNDAHEVSLVADTDERQIGALDVSGKVRFVVGSDPARLPPRPRGRRARLGVDEQGARRRACARASGTSAGAATGALEVSTRSGDTQTPDATWSAWSTPGDRRRPDDEPRGALRPGPRPPAGRRRVDRRRDAPVRDREPARGRDRGRRAPEGQPRGEGQGQGASRRAAASRRSTTSWCT